MKKKNIIIVALLCYLLLILAGGAAYYFFVMEAPKPSAPAVQAEMQDSAAKAQQEKEAAEEAAKEAKAKAESQKRQQEIQTLEGKMQRKDRGTSTMYYFPSDDKPAPGVYLRPYVVDDEEGNILLMQEVYYYYTINDPAGTNWIFGDHLDMTADGQTTTEVFNPENLHKFMATDAESLSERYTVVADKSTIDALRRIGNAKNATIRYYKKGEKQRTHTLSSKEKARVRQIVQLYDLMKDDKATR